MTGNVQIEIPADGETPEQTAAREKAEAAAIARGEGVDIEHRNKSTGQSIKHAATDGDLPVRPDNIPEKFWNAEKGEVNVEALLKAQSDGEAYIAKLRSGKPDPAPAPAADDKPPTEKPAEPSSDDGQPKVSQENAVQKARDEFAEKGALSSETYAALEEHGLSKDMVDGYLDQVRSTTVALREATFEGAGGEQEFNTMAAWAAENMPAEEVAAINTLLASDNPVVAKKGAAQLKAYYDSNADVDPTVRVTGSGNASAGAYFKSRHEMTEAMKDPRYSRDEAYRAEVAMKIHRATANKVDLFS